MTSVNPFAGRFAVVTGAASGIGRAVAGRLAAQGASVVVADVDGARAREAAGELAGAGGSVSAAALDVTDAAAVADLVEKVAAESGRLDYLFNNAGVGLAGEVRDTALADWDRLVDVNLRGVIHGVAAAYPLMVARGSGHIVNTASIAGLVPFPLSVAYAATKHAVVGLSTSLRAEGAPLGVKVSVVCPGFVDTPMKDNNRYVGMDKAAAIERLPFKLHPVEACAAEILAGVARNRGVIVVTPQARLLWRFYRAAPRLFDAVNARVAKRSHGLRKEGTP